MHDLRAPLIALALLLFIIAIALIVSLYILPQTQNIPLTSTVTPLRKLEVPPPPRTKANSTSALKQTMFSVLVSYVDGNFEPSSASVKAGDTIRFTNNSVSDIKLCGTAFDSCKTLKSGEYREFTFTKAGTWNYKNDLDSSAQGSITVQ